MVKIIIVIPERLQLIDGRLPGITGIVEPDAVIGFIGVGDICRRKKVYILSYITFIKSNIIQFKIGESKT